MINKLTPYVTFLIVHLSLIFFVYPEKILDSASRGHWQPVLVSCAFELAMIWLYLSALCSFPNGDIVDFFNRNTAKWVSRIILLPLVVYFFASFVLLMRSHVEVLTIVLTPGIPIWALMILFTISLYAAYSEPHVILRASFMVGVIFIPVILFCLIASFQHFDPLNVMPFMRGAAGFWSSKPFYSGLFALSGFLFVGLMRPFIRLDRKIMLRYILLYAAIIFPLFMISVYVPLAVFGQETVVNYMFPLIEAMDTIDLFWLMFERVTIFYVAATLSFVMMYVAILIWATALLIRKLYAPAAGRWLPAAVAVVGYGAACLIGSWDTIEELIWLDTGLRFYCIAFIPCLLATIGFAHRRKGLAH